VERPKSHWSLGQAGRLGLGSAGRPPRRWWAEAVAHLGAILALPPLTAFPPKRPACGTGLFLHRVITGAGGGPGSRPGINPFVRPLRSISPLGDGSHWGGT